MDKRIAITYECVADIPSSLAGVESSDIIYYDIETDRGIFRDTDEIDANNVVEYIGREGKRIKSIVPTADDYLAFFKGRLEQYDEVVHICISSKISASFTRANHAKIMLGEMGNRIRLIDSYQLSSGIGFLVMEAVRCRNAGMGSADIVKNVCAMINRVTTSFITKNTEYLYYKGKLGALVKKLCRRFHLHPVLQIKDGTMVVDKLYMGSYERAVKKYIKKLFKHSENIYSDFGFLTYVGCTHDMRESIRAYVKRYIDFKTLFGQPASAAVSSNCGPLTFGVIFLKKIDESQVNV